MDYLSLNASRDFLAAARQTSQAKPMSIRQLSRKLGFASDRTLGMVLKGQRAMSVETQSRLVRFLKLTPKEQLYLQSLVRREKLGDPCSAVRRVSSETRRVAAADLYPLIPAYSLVILELLRVTGRPLKMDEIRCQLRQNVDSEELSHVLERLLAVGLVKSETEGYFRGLSEAEYVTTSVDVPSQAIREIHRAQLQRASEVLDLESTLDREFSAKTLTVSSAKIAEIKRLIREKFEELAVEIVHPNSAEPTVVVQLNIQFYMQSQSSPPQQA